MLFEASGARSYSAPNAGEPGREHRRERQVRVARRVGGAVLDAGRSLLAGLVHRDPDERAPVAPRPAHVDGRLEPGHETLVRVHPLVRERADLRRVAEDPRDVGLGRLRQVVLVGPVEERVAVAFEQRLVRVHPGAVHAGDGLRHERGVDAELMGDLLHREAVRHHLVGHRERVGVAQVDLVLRGRDLVVDVLDGDPHRLEVLHRALAVVRGDVERRLVEVPALVEERRVVERLEVEVLELRADVEREALVRGARELTLQDAARVAGERRAVRARGCRRTSAPRAARSSRGSAGTWTGRGAPPCPTPGCGRTRRSRSRRSPCLP